MKIGFFDSGIGGLTILRAARKHMPQYDYVYFGDTANLPYGGKSEEEVEALTRTAILKLFEEHALLVVVACNTASAESLRKLQDTMLIGPYQDRKLLGVIIPTIETLVDSKARKTLLIGTERTIASQKYERELLKVAKSIEIVGKATPELVPLIESGDLHAAEESLSKTLDAAEGEIDALVLGCTHYTVLKDFIRSQYGLKVISQDEIIPEKLDNYLNRHPEIRERLTQGGTLGIRLTEENASYAKLKNELLTA